MSNPNTFHSFRDGNHSSRHVTRLEKVWSLHNRYPLPSPINRFIRETLLFYARMLRFKLSDRIQWHLARRAGKDLYGDPVVPQRFLVNAVATFPEISTKHANAEFAKVHEINERLRNKDGSWIAQPFALYHGKGVSIEEVALRINGYLDAFIATNEAAYQSRAMEAVQYLLRKRMFADGHVHLEGHTAIDTTYTYCGLALLRAWEQTGERHLFDAALKIGQQLLKYHISGSINHAITPCQLLGPLYKHTGQENYLKAVVRRVKRTAFLYQRPYGGWDGHESWSWYHAIITKSLITAYISAPFTLPFQSFKDRLAISIYAALNRLLVCQESTGRIKAGRGQEVFDERDGEYSTSPIDQQVQYQPDSGFVKVREPRLEPHCHDLELLIHARECINLPPLESSIEGVAHYLFSKSTIWRPEFNTWAIGRYLAYRHRRSSTVHSHAGAV